MSSGKQSDSRMACLARLETFSLWPLENPKPVDLATAGFEYTGNQDVVRCRCCDVLIGDWEQGDVPFDRHCNIATNCTFLQENYENSNTASLKSSNTADDNTETKAKSAPDATDGKELAVSLL